MVLLDEVNLSKGMSAKGKWKESTTDDAMMSVLAPSVPAKMQMIRLGTMATARVMMLRSQRTICGGLTGRCERADQRHFGTSGEMPRFYV